MRVMGLARWRPGPVIVNLEGSDIWGRDSVPFSASGPPSSLDLAGNQHGVAGRKIRGPPRSYSLSFSLVQCTGVGIRLG